MLQDSRPSDLCHVKDDRCGSVIPKQTDIARWYVFKMRKIRYITGIRGIISFYQSGTADLQDMLINECDIMFECRFVFG